MLIIFKSMAQARLMAAYNIMNDKEPRSYLTSCELQRMIRFMYGTHCKYLVNYCKYLVNHYYLQDSITI